MVFLNDLLSPKVLFLFINCKKVVMKLIETYSLFSFILTTNGFKLKILRWSMLVYKSYNRPILSNAKCGISRLPVEVPTKRSYSLFSTSIKYCATPPANAPLLPPPLITNALILIWIYLTKFYIFIFREIVTTFPPGRHFLFVENQ